MSLIICRETKGRLPERRASRDLSVWLGPRLRVIVNERRKSHSSKKKKKKKTNNRPLQSDRRVRLVFKRRCFWRRTPTGCVYPFMRIIDGFARRLFGRQWILLEVAWHASWFDDVEECVRRNERGENLVQGVCFTSSQYAKEASGISGIWSLIIKCDAWKALCQPCPTSLATWPHWSNQNIPLMTSI